jgi:hypothetical protein
MRARAASRAPRPADGAASIVDGLASMPHVIDAVDAVDAPAAIAIAHEATPDAAPAPAPGPTSS